MRSHLLAVSVHNFPFPYGDPGFGMFDVRQRQAREEVNPQTRQRIEILPTLATGFRSGKVCFCHNLETDTTVV